MANLFIGFPVPRAKIADMIEGAAPPLEHHANHEAGGADEMDVTDLVGAGGAAGVFRGLWLVDYNADATAWHKAYTGDGALTRSYDVLKLKTNDNQASKGTIYRKVTQSIPTLTWAKKRHLIFQAYLDCDQTSTAEMHIITGYHATGPYIGFQVVGGKLYGVNRNTGSITQTELLTFPQTWIGVDIWLEAILFPGDKVEFWIDGSLEQTSTTNLPEGTAKAEYSAELIVDNAGQSQNVQMEFTHIQTFQEA